MGVRVAKNRKIAKILKIDPKVGGKSGGPHPHMSRGVGERLGHIWPNTLKGGGGVIEDNKVYIYIYIYMADSITPPLLYYYTQNKSFSIKIHLKPWDGPRCLPMSSKVFLKTFLALNTMNMCFISAYGDQIDLV